MRLADADRRARAARARLAPAARRSAPRAETEWQWAQGVIDSLGVSSLLRCPDEDRDGVCAWKTDTGDVVYQPMTRP